MVAEKKSTQHKLSFRFPANDKGFEMVKQMRKAVNKDSYKFRTLYTGKRYPSGAGTTKKENADTIRVYLDSKRTDDDVWGIRSEAYNRGLEAGRIEAEVAIQKEHFEMAQLLKETEKEGVNLSNRLSSAEEKMTQIETHFEDGLTELDTGSFLKDTNEKGFNILESKLLLINAYIGAIENKNNHSRRIEALKQVVYTINSITDIN